MRVLVTGGTGFVGSHAVRALRAAGHEPRILARSPAGTDTVRGDVTDRASVEAAVVGCDAVIHCGSVFSFDPRDEPAIRATNVTGTENVLGAALAAGCDPVVHVSSTLALLPSATPLHADSDPGDSAFPYARSKADSERVARRFQAEGAPVVTVAPGWVWGPDDPRLGESSQVVRDLARGRMRLVPPGRTAIVDVRDLAALLARTLVPGLGPRRFLASGTTATFPELAAMVGAATGRPKRILVVPALTALWTGALADRLRRFGPRLPANQEGIWVYVNGPATDDGETWTGIVRRSLADTVADQVRWLASCGVIPAPAPDTAAEVAT